MIVKTKEIFNEDTHRQNLSISIDGDYTINIAYNYKNEQNEFISVNKQINGNDIFIPNFIYSVCISKDRKSISDPLHLYLTKDVDMHFYRYAYDLAETIFIIYFGETIDDIMVVSLVPYLGDCEIHDKQKSLDCILEKYPQYKYRYNKKILKNKLFANIEYGESFTAIEAQLDFVTLILKTILDLNPDLKNEIAKKIDNLDLFFDICDTENILSIKPQEKLFSDITNQKKLIREEQSKYWEELEKIRNEV